MLCQFEECPHYSKATKYPRACYYELQCWRGWLTTIVEMSGSKPIATARKTAKFLPSFIQDIYVFGVAVIYLLVVGLPR